MLNTIRGVIILTYTLTNLKQLYAKMKDAEVSSTIFQYSYHSKPFSCILLIDCEPFLLYITALGKPPFSIELNINKGFKIEACLNSTDYYNLVKYLELKRDDQNPFKPLYFFQALNDILTNISVKKPRYTEVLEVVRLYRDIEEKDKIYFCGWRKNSYCNVTPQNLEKTQSAFGKKYADFCKAHNISSCWTDIKEKECLAKISELLSNIP